MSRILKSGENQITNPYSSRHRAVDVVKKWYQKDTVICHSDGLVVLVQKGRKNNRGSTGNESYGNFVKVKHKNGYYTLYAHLDTVLVNSGASIKKGDTIGAMGNSGNAYGAHLHFELRDENNNLINPTNYLNSDLPNKSITYQAYDNIKKMWLPNVRVGDGDYAGNFGNPIGGIYLDNYKMRVHDKKKGIWLPWVTNRNDYAGNLGNDIDGVQIYGVRYRAHLKGRGWLSYVNKVDNTSEGYAGIYGRSIDAIEIK